MPVILILMRGMIWQITSHSYPHQTAVSLLQTTTSQPISTEGVVICHKIWEVAESLCAVLHGNLVACTHRERSRIAPSNIIFMECFFFFMLSFFMSDDLWPEKELAVLSRKPLNFACIKIIHQVTIPVGIYFLSSLGQRCTVYVHLNSIHSVWGWKFIVWFWLLYCTVDWYQLVQFKFTAQKN